jgi:hypothetical protein
MARQSALDDIWLLYIQKQIVNLMHSNVRLSFTTSNVKAYETVFRRRAEFGHCLQLNLRLASHHPLRH